MMKLKQFSQHLIRRGQVGQSIVILALGMIALLGFVGLTTDVSIMFVRYNNLRRAVDSAAIAAAGQVRQTSEGAASDVITRASMAARQFIEFHGLNPRDVWVEMCENQPRRDFAPGTPGLQLEPLAVTLSRDAFTAVKQQMANLERAGQTAQAIALRDDYLNKAYDYAEALENAVEGALSPEVLALQGNMQGAGGTWLDDRGDDDWDDFVSTLDPLFNGLSQAAGIDSSDLGVCSEDVRKLVRVTAQIDSPTVFLRLFNFDTITLQASAVSETALLDVVLIMDVSETMARDTSYEDWAKVNLGMAYIPPFLYGPVAGNMATVTNNLINKGFIPTQGNTTVVHFQNVGITNYMDVRWASPSLWGAGTQTPPAGGRSGSWNEWFWLEYIMSEWPHYINQRLNFLEPTSRGGGPVVDDPSNPPQVQTNPLVQYTSQRNQPSGDYPVRSFAPSTHSNSVNANHPREECRVRFFPYSFFLNMVNNWPTFPYSGAGGQSVNIAQYYVAEGALNGHDDWSYIQNNNPDTLTPGSTLPRWGSFVPTYNFYGCCNDPTTGVYVSDGTEQYRDVYTGNLIPNGEYVVAVSAPLEGFTRLGNRVPSNDWQNQSLNTQADKNFADLVCQPFKQAKDATRQFLRRIDFLRGDRVAFVTYDRSAFLVNPDLTNTGEAHMIESYARAVDTLDRVIGVRAEPNYYVWNTDTTEPVVPHWTGFAAGIDENGNSIPLDYGFTETDITIDLEPSSGTVDTNSEEWQDLVRRAGAAAANYPVYNNCSLLNALTIYPFSLYTTRNTSPSSDIIPIGSPNNWVDFQNYTANYPAVANSVNPNFLDQTVVDGYGDTVPNPWYTYVQNLSSNERSEYTNYPRAFQYTYERHSMCAGGNIGAALRAAHSALNDPRTSRRDGAVWIIVLLSDGAVGTSSPVRRQGNKLNSLEPYHEVQRFNYQDFLDDLNDAPNGSQASYNAISQQHYNSYGRTGAEYGAYGLCPFGAVDFQGTGARLGELITGDADSFPWCSRANPYERHFCLQTGELNQLQWVGYNQRGLNDTTRNENAFGPGFMPNAWDREYRFRIAESQAQYEAELATAANFNRAPELVRPMPDDYPFSESQWIEDENVRFNNIFDVDLGNPYDPANRCDPLYDPYDYARDWADFITGVHSDDSSNLQLPIIFTIGFGLTFEGDGTCSNNMKKCLGEELLRYIADAGDNFRIDNDVQQDLLGDRYNWRLLMGSSRTFPTLNGVIVPDEEPDWGPKDPCEPETYLGASGPSPIWRPSDPDNPTPLNLLVGGSIMTRTNGSCGNYFNAPSLAELERVFDEIASRMFTRLSG